MNISYRLYITFTLLLTLQIPINLVAHPVKPITAAVELTTSEELHNALTSSQLSVIMLKMEHCPHCQTLSPVFEKYARKLLGKPLTLYVANGPALQAATMIKNVTNNTVKIPGYPSIMYVKNGKVFDHQIGGNTKTFEEKIQKLTKNL